MRITFAYPRTTADGKQHEPDSTADVDDAEAKQLVKDGFARPAEKKTRAQSTSSVGSSRPDSTGSGK